MQQNDRFVEPSGNPLQPSTIIVCDDISFVVSNNGKIYNFFFLTFERFLFTVRTSTWYYNTI